MDNSQAVSRGHRAFVEMEELKDVFDRLERGLLQELKQTPIGSDTKVNRLHVTLQTLSQVQTALREMIDNGRIAEHALAVAGLNRPN
jgi:hypothetical protein